jgi:DNA-binding SARP family transcriptional activator
VLAGRRPPAVPLARLRAVGEVVEVDETALAFTATEVDALAGAAGGAAGRAAGLAGWPALVRLAMSAPAGATGDFLWEEVVDALPDAQRIGLLALATIGGGEAADVARVAGVPVDVADLVAGVPLVTMDDGGRLRAHDLWEGVVAGSFPPGDVGRVRRRAVEVLLERGEAVRAGWCAHRWGETGLLAAAARALVRTTLGALPRETAERWLAGVGPAGDHPDLALLRLAVRQARHRDDPGLDALVDDLAARYAAAGDAEGQAAALAVGLVAAHFRGDLGRVVQLSGRVAALPGADEVPVLRFLVGAVGAALAALQGDADATLATLDALPHRVVDARTAELVSRLEVAMLLLVGRADEAARVAEATLADAPSAYVRVIPPVVRWLAGDPGALRGRALPTEPDPDTNARDRLYHAAYGTSVFASLGDRASVAAAWPVIGALAPERLDARDSAIVAGAVATRRVLEHDEPGAARTLAEHLARHPLSVPASELHLRRVLPIAYVLDDRARRCWDGATLGPAHDRARTIARALLGGRAGAGPVVPPAPAAAVLTALPLPWSVELAARAAAGGEAHGAELAVELAGWAGPAVRAELERLAQAGDHALRAGAERLLAQVPAAGGPRLRVELLGPVRVLLDGHPVDEPDLRRGRVRTLLALLAVAGPLRRERIMDLMWPDHDPAAASRNLRVALSRLRRVVEPARLPGAVLRVEGDTVALAGPPLVGVDAAELDLLLAEAARARAAGDAAREADHLDRAARLWRGEPLTDLAWLDDLAPEVEHARRSLVDGTLRLGELRLAAGRTADALRCAERARRASPYDERAHRLVVAARMQRHDPAGVLDAVAEVEGTLAEAGLAPEPATAMLLRQARHRAGTGRAVGLVPVG